MITEKIGANAGLVWNILENGETEIKVLKKAVKLTEKDLHLALGWLAREGKIAFRKEGKEMFIGLA